MIRCAPGCSFALTGRSGGNADMRGLQNRKMSAQARFMSHTPAGVCMLVFLYASSAPGLALFSVREVSAARVAMGSGRTRLARVAGLCGWSLPSCALVSARVRPPVIHVYKEEPTELAYIDTLANSKIRADSVKRMTKIQNIS